MEHSTIMPSQQAFVVTEQLGRNLEFQGMGTNLTMDGLEVDTPGRTLAGREFVWLEFGLADTDERVKALGQITERSEVGIKFRFKHLFPDQRRKLAIFLDEDAGDILS
jgi:hypothetical protein